MEVYSHTCETSCAAQTEEAGAKLAGLLEAGNVVALYGRLGAGKTAFVRGLARGLGMDAGVSSPTFAIVHDYGGCPALIHFDMYRVSSWDDLDTCGYFDYLDGGAILVVEWAENIESALPPDAWRVVITPTEDTVRLIRIDRAVPQKG